MTGMVLCGCDFAKEFPLRRLIYLCRQYGWHPWKMERRKERKKKKYKPHLSLVVLLVLKYFPKWEYKHRDSVLHFKSPFDLIGFIVCIPFSLSLYFIYRNWFVGMLRQENRFLPVYLITHWIVEDALAPFSQALSARLALDYCTDDEIHDLQPVQHWMPWLHGYSHFVALWIFILPSSRNCCN